MSDVNNIEPIARPDPIPLIGKDDLVEGGPEGAANIQAKAIANNLAFIQQRTYSKTDVDDLVFNLQEMISAAEKGLAFYETESELLSVVLPPELSAAQARDTAKIYLWKIKSAVGVEPVVWGWVDTGYTDLEMAKSYTREKVSEVKTDVDNLLIFAEIENSGLDYAVADEKGNVALGIDKQGNVIAKNLKSDVVNINNDVISDLDNSVFSYAVTDESGNVAFGVKKDGTIFPEYKIEPEVVTEINLALQKTDWIHGHTYGQSLSRGSGSYPVVSTVQPFSNITFKSGVLPRLSDLHDYSDVKPLVEQRWNASGAEGESPTSGMLNKISELATSSNENFVFFGASSGQGGTSLINLSKGTTRYNEQLEMYKAAYSLAQSRGLSYSVGFIGFVQGESNYNANTSREEYKKMMVQLKRDFDLDIKGITNQNFSPIMVTYQTASHFVASTRRDHVNIALAQLDAHRENKDIVMACSMYSIEYLADNLHLTANSSQQLGKYLGKAAYKTMRYFKGMESEPFKPLEPLEVIWQGKIIDITFNVPIGDLVIDTNLVAQTHNYGFDIWLNDVLQEQAILSVSIVENNRVRIILNQSYENAVLSYARGRPSDPVASGPISGPRGNIRDKAGDDDNYLDSLGIRRYMYNWLVIFQYSQNKGFY